MLRKSVVFFSLAALVLSGATLIAQPQKSEEQHSTGPAVQSAIDQEAMKYKIKEARSDAGLRINKLPEPRRTDRAGDSPAARDKGGPISIVYDNGVSTATPGTSSLCWGNQFSSRNGNPVGSFSVTMVTFYIVSGAGTDNVFISLFGPVSGTSASPLGSVSVPLNNGSAAFNTHTFATPVAGAGSFLAGVWYVAGDSVGLNTTATVNGQGNHGMVINDFIGTGFSTFAGNALVRAKTAVIPVELMDFTVTDN